MGCGSSVTVDETPERSRVELMQPPEKRHIQAPLHSTPSPRALAAADKATRHWLVRSLPRFHYTPKVNQSQEPAAPQNDSFSSAEGTWDRRRGKELDRTLIVESLESSWNRNQSAVGSPAARYSPTMHLVAAEVVSEALAAANDPAFPAPAPVPSTLEYITGLSTADEQPTRCESPLLNRSGVPTQNCSGSNRSSQGHEDDEGGVACSDCMVCLNPLPDQRLVTLPCFHTFHEDCVLDWLNEKGLCPTCRTPLTPAALTWSYEFQEELLQQYD